jgi:hypothetical protein
MDIYCGSHYYLDIACDLLDDIFTTEFAENTEIMLVAVRALEDFLCAVCDLERSPAKRDASSGGELVSKQQGPQ